MATEGHGYAICRKPRRSENVSGRLGAHRTVVGGRTRLHRCRTTCLRRNVTGDPPELQARIHRLVTSAHVRSLRSPSIGGPALRSMSADAWTDARHHIHWRMTWRASEASRRGGESRQRRASRGQSPEPVGRLARCTVSGVCLASMSPATPPSTCIIRQAGWVPPSQRPLMLPIRQTQDTCRGVHDSRRRPHAANRHRSRFSGLRARRRDKTDHWAAAVSPATPAGSAWTAIAIPHALSGRRFGAAGSCCRRAARVSADTAIPCYSGLCFPRSW
jgi:hypothetical protein